MKKKIIGLLLIVALIAITLTNFVKNKVADEEKVDTSSTQVAASAEKTLGENDIKEGLETNQQAPDFKLTTLDGKEVKLSDYRGKKVILNFWATWCPPCKEEIPQMEKYYKNQAKNENVEILAVNLTKSDKDENYIADFVKTYDMTYPVLLDKEGKQQEKYEIVTIPTSYFIDTKGIIQKVAIGPVDHDLMVSAVASMK